MKIDTTKAFVLFANMDVEYDGRASSTLPTGNYLIVKKIDGSILVHGSTKCPPKNYQGTGTKLTLSDNVLTARSKKESLKMTLHNIISYCELDDWSDHQIAMTRTESELQAKLVANLSEHIPNIISIKTNHVIDVGAIDILAKDASGCHHIIEVKRKKTGIGTVYQLQRYMDYFIIAKGYVAAPALGKKALEMMKEKGYRHLSISF